MSRGFFGWSRINRNDVLYIFISSLLLLLDWIVHVPNKSRGWIFVYAPVNELQARYRRRIVLIEKINDYEFTAHACGGSAPLSFSLSLSLYCSLSLSFSLNLSPPLSLTLSVALVPHGRTNKLKPNICAYCVSLQYVRWFQVCWVILMLRNITSSVSIGRYPDDWVHITIITRVERGKIENGERLNRASILVNPNGSSRFYVHYHWISWLLWIHLIVWHLRNGYFPIFQFMSATQDKK